MHENINEKRLLIILFTNDNHISNVKTIQSIYRQSYPHLYLAVCNDCTDHFQSERLLYNLEPGQLNNIHGVYFHENPYPCGEYLTQKRVWNHADTDYVITLHAGEYFTDPEALTRCVRYLEDDGSIDALVVSAELWTNDMKQCSTVYAAVGAGEPKSLTFLQQVLTPQEKIRDCMVMYRLSALRGQDFQVRQDCTAVSQTILPVLLSQKKNVAALPEALCKFSVESIEDIVKPIPDTFGNKRLDNIAELLQKKPPEDHRLFVADELVPASEQKKNYSMTLYKYSRFSKLKSYVVIDLLALICAVVLLTTKNIFFMTAGKTLIVAVVLLFCWTAIMLGCNLYFKKNPRKLVLEK